jgi:hypothetical protein
MQSRVIATLSAVCPNVHLTATNAGNFPAKTSAVLTAQKQELMYTLVRPDKSRAVSTHNWQERHAIAARGLGLAEAQRRGLQPQELGMVMTLLRVTLDCKAMCYRISLHAIDEVSIPGHQESQAPASPSSA